MASRNDAQYVALQRAQRLRAVLGVSAPQTSSSLGGSSIAWQQVPFTAASTSTQPVVCLHDAGSGSREFRPLIDRLPIDTSLLLLDWPGHGRSAEAVEPRAFSIQQCASRLSEVLSQLRIVRPILLGGGFGAAVAIHYAAGHPTEVAGLVLCQPAGLVSPADTMDKAAASRINGLGRRQALRVEIVRPALRRVYDAALASIRRSEAGLRLALKSLPCPIFFALSRESRMYPLKTCLDLLDPLLKSTPRHRLTIFNGDFNPVWDEPDRFAQALTGFVQAQLPLSRHRHAWLLSAVDWPTRSMNLWKCVHPECPAEQALPEGQNANDALQGLENIH